MNYLYIRQHTICFWRYSGLQKTYARSINTRWVRRVDSQFVAFDIFDYFIIRSFCVVKVHPKILLILTTSQKREWNIPYSTESSKTYSFNTVWQKEGFKFAIGLGIRIGLVKINIIGKERH